MNSVTGMTAVFRRDVAMAAQPFPLSGCRYILHDHWIALVASLLGSVRFIDEPLVDYTQHAANVMGAREWAGKPAAQRLASHRRPICANAIANSPGVAVRSTSFGGSLAATSRRA